MPRRQKRDESEDEEDVENHNLGDEMDDTPPTVDPYEVLGLETSATGDEVKKAYRKLALIHHPDKAPEADKSVANKKFQEIAFAYAVLSDERRRKRYDLTGSTAESLEDDDDFDWLSFYRQQFEDVVNEENINRIATEYKGSEQERKDIYAAYTQYKGRLDKIYEDIMLSDILEDDDRFRKIIDEGIDGGAIESYPAYERVNNDAAREKAKAAERKRRADWDKKHGGVKEAAEKAKAKQKTKAKKGGSGGSGGLADLQALIQGRQRDRMGGFDSLVGRLEEKYGGPKSRGKKRATPMDTEPTEDEFLATQKKLFTGKKNPRSSKKVVQEHDEDEDIDLGSDEEEEVTPPPKPAKRGRATNTRNRTKAKA